MSTQSMSPVMRKPVFEADPLLVAYGISRFSHDEAHMRACGCSCKVFIKLFKSHFHDFCLILV